jgi:hypothetical protein
LNKRYEIADGILTNEFFFVECKQIDGRVAEFELNMMSGISKGNRVWINNAPAPDGRYKAGFLHNMSVSNGLVK